MDVRREEKELEVHQEVTSAAIHIAGDVENHLTIRR